MRRSANQIRNGFAEREGIGKRDVVQRARRRQVCADGVDAAVVINSWCVKGWQCEANKWNLDLAGVHDLDARAICWPAIDHD